MADTETKKETSSEAAKAEAPKLKSASMQLIPSRCVKKHFNEDGATVEVGTKIVFKRTEDNFYPYPIMRPVDETLDLELQAEYNTARQAMNEAAKNRTAITTAELLRRLAETAG